MYKQTRTSLETTATTTTGTGSRRSDDRIRPKRSGLSRTSRDLESDQTSFSDHGMWTERASTDRGVSQEVLQISSSLPLPDLTSPAVTSDCQQEQKTMPCLDAFSGLFDSEPPWPRPLEPLRQRLWNPLRIRLMRVTEHPFDDLDDVKLKLVAIPIIMFSLPALAFLLWVVRIPSIGTVQTLGFLLAFLFSAAAAVFQVLTGCSAQLTVEVLSPMLLIAAVVADRGGASSLDVRTWMVPVLLLGCLVLCKGRRSVLASILLISCGWCLVERVEAVTRFGLYGGENLNGDGLSPSACDCSSPPCGIPASTAVGGLLFQWVLIVASFYLSVKLPQNDDIQLERSQEADVAEEVAVFLSRYETDQSLELLHTHGSHLSERLMGALIQLTENLREFQPFIPMDLLAVLGTERGVTSYAIDDDTDTEDGRVGNDKQLSVNSKKSSLVSSTGASSHSRVSCMTRSNRSVLIDTSTGKPRGNEDHLAASIDKVLWENSADIGKSTGSDDSPHRTVTGGTPGSVDSLLPPGHYSSSVATAGGALALNLGIGGGSGKGLFPRENPLEAQRRRHSTTSTDLRRRSTLQMAPTKGNSGSFNMNPGLKRNVSKERLIQSQQQRLSLQITTSVGVGRSKQVATVVVGRCNCSASPSDKGTVSPHEKAGKFASAVIGAVIHDSGVITSTMYHGDCVFTVGAWNVSRACSSHQLNACSSMLRSAEALAAEHVTGWSLSSVAGAVRTSVVGCETMKTPILVGAAQKVAFGLSGLAGQIGSVLLLDERVFSRARSEYSIRIVDAVNMDPTITPGINVAEGEVLVYELLGRKEAVKSNVDDRFVEGFSLIRQGMFSMATDKFAAQCAADSQDSHARRLLRIAHFLYNKYGDTGPPYVREMCKHTWDDLEGKSAETKFTGRFEGLGLEKDESSESDSSSDRVLVEGIDPLSLRNSESSKTETTSRGTPPVDLRELSTTGRRNTVTDDGRMLKRRLDDIVETVHKTMSFSCLRDRQEIPRSFVDARGRRYHRSSTRLGKGAFGEVWLGMGDDATMVAVKTLRLVDVEAGAGAVQASNGADPTWLKGTNLDTVDPGGTIAGTVAQRDGSVPSEGGEKLRSRVEQMVQEVTLMTSLRNENVVQYLGCAAEGHFVLLIMEYLPGGSLQSLKSQFGGMFPPSCAKRFAGDIVRGLLFIHGNQIVHRDLKPANVLVTAEGQARLADFGASAELAFSGGIAGTPLYMAPEQARGEACFASDIWSLGLIMIDLVALAPFYDSKITSEPVSFMFALARNADFVPQLPFGLPADVKAIASKCLVRNPEDRPTAKQLLSYAYFLS
eukprot:Hpha_TRINITY_DN16386_c3_g5::TRINITY_DN16386_c3_g5_i1::g.62637::m.62637